MRKKLMMVFLAGIGLAAPACAAGLLSATRGVVAILADDLFVGEAEGHLNGAGTLAIRSQKNPTLSCLGRFTSSAAQGGTGQLECSDGTTATFTFQRLSVYRGFGVAQFGGAAMSFAYGFAPEEVGAYLKLPEGKKLTRNGNELQLADL